MPTPHTTRVFRFVALGFGASALVLLGVVLAVTLGRTTVTITLTPQAVRTSFALTVAPEPPDGGLTGRYLTTTVDGQRTVTGTTTATQPAKARGTIRIINDGPTGQPLAATTRLLSSTGVLFRTTRRVDVPGHGSLAVEVEADEAGSAGEIGPSRFTLPGLRAANQTIIYGQSDAPMTGGTTSASAVTEADREAARTALETELIATGLRDLEAALTQQGQVFRITLLDQTVKPKATGPSTISLSVSLQAVAVDPAALRARTETALRETLPDASTLEALSGEPVLAVSEADAKAERVTLAVTASGLATPDAGNSLFAAKRFTGRTAEQVRAAASELPGVTNVDVDWSLPWLQRTPSDPARIRVRLLLQSLTTGGEASTVETTPADTP